MKASIFHGGRDIRIEKVDTPTPSANEVLFRILSAGVCGSDLHPYRGDTPAGPREPHQRGHELAGEIVELGEGVTSLSIGQRIGIEAKHLLGCGSCRYCKRGENHLCATRGYKHGERQESHGFSQYDVCPAENCHPLPDSVSNDAAALLDCYACGVHALNRVDILPTDTIAILGTGAIGMTLGQVAKAYGIGRVIMIGTRQPPLDMALKANATDETVANSDADPIEAVMQMTNGEGVDIVFETVGGNAPTIDQAIGMARRGGVISILGGFTQSQTVNIVSAYQKELRIQWSNSFSSWKGVSEYKTSLDLMIAGKLDPTEFITHHYGIDDIGKAFEDANDKRSSGALKVMVHPNG